MAAIRINGEVFGYQLDGNEQDPVLVLSNSLGTTRDMWSRQIDHLRKTHRILRYDTRGHGESVSNPGPYRLEQLGQDTLDLLDALRIETFSFCGISMGGLIGQWLGVHAGERLRKLVVCNTAARIGQQSAWQERAALVRKQGMAPVADASASRWFTQTFVDAQPGCVQTLVQGLRDTHPEGYAACCEALAVADLRESIKTIKTPTLVVAGRHDPVTTPADADFIAERIGNATRIDLDASHLSNIEADNAFNTAVSAFLA